MKKLHNNFKIFKYKCIGNLNKHNMCDTNSMLYTTDHSVEAAFLCKNVTTK